MCFACNPSTVEAETGESLAGKFLDSEKQCLKNKLDSSTWTAEGWPLASKCMHTHLPEHIQTHTHPHATHIRGENRHVCDLWKEAKITVANSTRTVLAKIHDTSITQEIFAKHLWEAPHCQRPLVQSHAAGNQNVWCMPWLNVKQTHPALSVSSSS